MLPCGQCGGSHRRYVITDRSIYNARYCGKCDIRHPVNDVRMHCTVWTLRCDLFGLGM